VEAALTKCLKQNIDQLEELSVLVRGDLLALDRKILTALITIDVHARDIIEDMLRFVTDWLISVQLNSTPMWMEHVVIVFMPGAWLGVDMPDLDHNLYMLA
jgi:hypothetical protein